MDKEVTFNSVDSLGRCFAEALHITQRGGGKEKVAGSLHPEISAYIRNLRPEPGFQYVLMTPMGAFEYWGMNVNGDVFPEMSLSFDRDRGPEAAQVVAKALEDKWLRPFGGRIPPGNYANFGYKTYLEANRYLHHVNKNPEISYGTIVLSVWNQSMHRVEVIARHDREKAKRVNADEVIRDLDEGKPRQISMGCKVPFDVCTVCGHISKTPNDYCDHLRLSMGSVLPDGRIVGAVNFFPRFFDLSDVFVPAAKESGVIMKVAHASRPRTTLKLASQEKAADISKNVLPNSSTKAIQDAVASEPQLATSDLRSAPLASVLSALSALGIVLKPQEFQDTALHEMGEDALCEKFRREGVLFPSTPYSGPPLDLGMPDLDLMKRFSGYLGDRSGLYPHLPQRILRIAVIRVSPAQGSPITKEAKQSSHPLLQKIAHVYGAYRQSLRELPRILDVAIHQHPEYYQENFFSDFVTDSLMKFAHSPRSLDLTTPMVPLYMYNAYRDEVVSPPVSWQFEIRSTSPAKALLGSAF